MNTAEALQKGSLDPRDFPLWRPTDHGTKAAVFGWDNPIVQAQVGAMVQKATADSTSVGPLIRQDLEPEIHDLFVKKFPLFEMISKVEANGLVHAYNQKTAYSQALNTPSTISESGAVTDDSSTYVRQTTNIAVFATRRGATLKSSFAVRAGGAPYGDPAVRELNDGLTKIAHDVQAELLRFNEDVAHNTAIASDPSGQYDANGINGMRYALQNLAPAGNTVAVDVSTPGWTDQRVLKGLRQAANTLIDAGGSPNLIIATVNGREQLFQDLIAQLRYNQGSANTMEVIPGVMLPKIAAGETELPIAVIPGDGIGSYTTGGTTNFVDMFVVNTEDLSIPWLGGPSVTVLELPIGTDGTLRKLYIPFGMYGFAQHAPLFMGRVQLKLHA